MSKISKSVRDTMLESQGVRLHTDSGLSSGIMNFDPDDLEPCSYKVMKSMHQVFLVIYDNWSMEVE